MPWDYLAALELLLMGVCALLLLWDVVDALGPPPLPLE